MLGITLGVTTVGQVIKSLLFSLGNKSAHHTESLVEYGHPAIPSFDFATHPRSVARHLSGRDATSSIVSYAIEFSSLNFWHPL